MVIYTPNDIYWRAGEISPLLCSLSYHYSLVRLPLLKSSPVKIETFFLYPKNLGYTSYNTTFLDKDIRNLSYVRVDSKSPEALNKFCFNQKVVFLVYNLTHPINLQGIASYI